LHRAFPIFVVDARGHIVVQQRSPAKYHSGGLWANSCCGHPRCGERTIAAARRRLGEELGVTSALSFGFFARYQAALSNGMHENEFVYVYFGRFKSEPRSGRDRRHRPPVVRRYRSTDQARAGFLHVLAQALFSPPWRRDRAASRTGVPFADDVRMHERHCVTDDRAAMASNSVLLRFKMRDFGGFAPVQCMCPACSSSVAMPARRTRSPSPCRTKTMLISRRRGSSRAVLNNPETIGCYLPFFASV
jgi:isopentenyl-diphosphate delta-isomerase type 1